MKNKTWLFAVITLLLAGLIHGLFLVEVEQTTTINVVATPTLECQPADSEWCQNLIPGCRPITAKRCQQPTSYNFDPYGIRQPTPGQSLEVLKTWLYFSTSWLIAVLLFIAWLIRCKTGGKDER